VGSSVSVFLEVDPGKCVASGACVLDRPDLFDFGEDGMTAVVVKHEAVSEDTAGRIIDACPMGAIFERDA
jgi:ferredoxin